MITILLTIDDDETILARTCQSSKAVAFRDNAATAIRDKPTALASPWQNRFAERLIGIDPTRVCGSYPRLG
jgi:hypothetical protein